MTEEKQDNPKFEFKDIKLGESMELTLDSPTPMKTGESTYGTWNMWFGIVEGAKVHYGRKPNVKTEEGYTGKVIMFPATKLNENLVKAANGNTGVKVKVTKTAEETSRGLITNYVVEKLSDGEASGTSSLLPTEQKLVDEAKDLKSQGYDITKDIFLKASQEPQYEGKISTERAGELYAFLN